MFPLTKPFWEDLGPAVLTILGVHRCLLMGWTANGAGEVLVLKNIENRGLLWKKVEY